MGARLGSDVRLVVVTARIAGPDDAPEIVAQLRGTSRVAIDTEFHAERRYLPQLYLVQLHIDGAGTWLVDPLDGHTLPAIAADLRAVPWIAHGAQQDIRLLADALGGVPDVVLDTQIAAGLIGTGYPSSYATLVERYLGRSLGKTATLSDWSRRPLSAEQIRYAVEDVLLLLPLWDRIAEDVVGHGRESHVRLACTEARETALAPRLDRAWREILGHANLAAHQAVVLQELVIWRDEVARREDQPPRAVLADALLLEISRRQPKSIDALAADRRMPRGILKRAGPDLLDRIQRAASRPEWAWPKVAPRESTAGRSATWFEVFGDAEGQSGRFSSRLVLPRTVIEDALLEPATNRERLRELLGPWRDPLVGDAVWAAMSGQVALFLRGGEVQRVTGFEAPSTGEKNFF